jgi:hypothetical protein
MHTGTPIKARLYRACYVMTLDGVVEGLRHGDLAATVSLLLHDGHNALSASIRPSCCSSKFRKHRLLLMCTGAQVHIPLPHMACCVAVYLGDLQLEDAVLVLRLDLAQVGVARQAHCPGRVAAQVDARLLGSAVAYVHAQAVLAK